MPSCPIVLLRGRPVAWMSPKRYAIRDWPEGERPRERLLAEGPRRLTTAELLAIVLRTGARGQSAVDLARILLQDWDGLAGLDAADPHALAEAKGLGPAKIAQVKAALELGRRLLAEVERAARPSRRAAGPAESPAFAKSRCANSRPPAIVCHAGPQILSCCLYCLE